MRESAKKVLVVFTDTSSGLDENALRSAASKLESKDIEVIGVAIGSDAFELGYITPHSGNVIDVTVDENPDKLSSEILTLILTGLPVTSRFFLLLSLFFVQDGFFLSKPLRITFLLRSLLSCIR